MLGAIAVGKTSLVRRYVDSIFSEKYTTTIGVKIDKKMVNIGEQELSLLLWDVYGEDNHQKVLPAYLRGMAGYLLVVDPTRPNTFKSAMSLRQLVNDTVGPKPFILVMNKSDLKDEWEADVANVQELVGTAVAVMETSAKTDSGVNEMFDNTEQGLKLQSEQQERLSIDILEEKNQKSSGIV